MALHKNGIWRRAIALLSQGSNILDASRREISTLKGARRVARCEREARHAWFTEADKVAQPRKNEPGVDASSMLMPLLRKAPPNPMQNGAIVHSFRTHFR
jgi:hypothetical protein